MQAFAGFQLPCYRKIVRVPYETARHDEGAAPDMDKVMDNLGFLIVDSARQLRNGIFREEKP